jgi:tRNA modification GTPase
MRNFDDTIAAISTPPGIGAIAVVRMSGPQSFQIAKSIFRRGSSSTENTKDLLKSHHAAFGQIIDPDSQQCIDEVVLTAFRSPHTYTGEDIVEISCHGSPVVASEILHLLLRSGARLAGPGEFTERAFLSGRIDLTQAEAVLDVIQAKTSMQGRRALSALSGKLGQRIRQVRELLMAVLTRIVAGIDFPEEIGDAPEPEVQLNVQNALAELRDLARTARSGKYLRDGLRLAIVGRPNAGKSSLLNQLLKYERAIVTDIPGTTRDALEELLDLNGIPVVLVDTAGIRPTEDQVERIGIERSKKAIDESDLVLLVIDVVMGWEQPEQQILELLGGKPYILIANKIDLFSQFDIMSLRVPENCVERVSISAQTGANIAGLTQAIEQFVYQDASQREGPSLNSRQGELCLKAADALELVLQTLSQGLPQDCLATDLKTAVDALSEISGESVSEEVITQVFATFCIGK